MQHRNWMQLVSSASKGDQLWVTSGVEEVPIVFGIEPCDGHVRALATSSIGVNGLEARFDATN